MLLILVSGFVYIYMCSRDVGLTGIVRMLIQKSTGIVRKILSIVFFRMSKASNNTRAAMKKQIRRIHSVLPLE